MAEKRKRKELTFACYVIMPGRGPVPVDELTEEERAQWHANMRERLSAEMSAYYSQHPEEYAKL